MTNVTALVKRHPVSAYLALVFAVSSGCDLIVSGPGGVAAGARRT